MMWLRWLCLILVLVSLDGYAQPEVGALTYGQSVLSNSEYTRVMRAIILAEKRTNRKQSQSMDGISFDSNLSALAGPLSQRYAANECGNVQHLLAYYLSVQGVPKDKLFFYQMRGKDGFLGVSASPHAVLVYEALDKTGQPVHLFLDTTYPQFETGMDALSKNPIGKSVRQEILQEGFWIATEQTLAEYERTFPGANPFPKRLQSLKDLSQNFLGNSPGEMELETHWKSSMWSGRVISGKNGNVAGYDTGDEIELRELNQIDSEMISRRVADGNRAVRALELSEEATCVDGAIRRGL